MPLYFELQLIKPKNGRLAIIIQESKLANERRRPTNHQTNKNTGYQLKQTKITNSTDHMNDTQS